MDSDSVAGKLVGWCLWRLLHSWESQGPHPPNGYPCLPGYLGPKNRLSLRDRDNGQEWWVSWSFKIKASFPPGWQPGGVGPIEFPWFFGGCSHHQNPWNLWVICGWSNNSPVVWWLDGKFFIRWVNLPCRDFKVLRTKKHWNQNP